MYSTEEDCGEGSFSLEGFIFHENVWQCWQKVETKNWNLMKPTRVTKKQLCFDILLSIIFDDILLSFAFDKTIFIIKIFFIHFIAYIYMQ